MTASAAAHGPPEAPPLPAPYLERMQHLLGDTFPELLESYDHPPASGLRVNTLKTTPAALGEIVPFALTPLDLASEAFLVDERDHPGRHPYHAAGLYYLQDPSAMAATLLLDPQPGERVLDLAAAPGGKSTHIAARLAGKGTLFTNEVHPRRVWDLSENLERWGARNAVVLNEAPQRLAQRFSGFFDRVLVDAPCSGEGLFRKTPAARLEWTPKLVESCAVRQDALLATAAAMVRPGGALAYATCTFAPEEDEAVIARFLATSHDFEMAAPPDLPGCVPARPDWVAPDAPGALAHAVRLWPHIGPGEGHFVAAMRRIGGAPPVTRIRAPRARRPAVVPAPRSVTALYHAFCGEHLTTVPGEQGILALAGSYLYAQPTDPPDLDGLRVIHPGWWLGIVRKDRFEPSHALALGLASSDAAQTRELRPDDAALHAYMRGDVLPDPGPAGWVLLTVSGFPLGWGKRAGGRLKSRYPKGLRRP